MQSLGASFVPGVFFHPTASLWEIKILLLKVGNPNGRELKSLDSEPQSTCPLPLHLLTAEGKLEITSAMLYPAKWPSLQRSFRSLTVQRTTWGAQ